MERFVNINTCHCEEGKARRSNLSVTKRLLRSLWSLAMTLILIGCGSTTIPHYIQDKHPYTKTFYADFFSAKQAAILALDDLGWSIEKEVDPKDFENTNSVDQAQRQQILLFSNIRKGKASLGLKNTRFNIYLREVSERETEIEIRYLTLTTLSIKSFYDYRNDAIANKIFSMIDSHL